MRRFTCGRWVLLVLVGLMITPGASWAQVQNVEQAPPFPMIPWPIGKPHMEEGGFFFAAEFLYMWENNPILSQTVASRGFLTTDTSITGTVHQFVGSGVEALNTNQLAGPTSFEPGIALYGGWRFENGVTLELGWWHVGETHYAANATLVPPGFFVGQNGADSFLFSPVFNFPLNYAGAPKDVNAGNAGGTFGIWNGASSMQLRFLQRFDQGTILFHVPVEQGDMYRLYGTFGFRTEIMWSQFKWTTVDNDKNGDAPPQDVAYYYNTISNRWYGADFGCGGDWYLGDTGVIGAFAITGELHGGLGLDFVKERAMYELSDFSTASRRNINTYEFSPLAQADVSLWWYPTQGVQVRLGWQALAVFNTVTSNRPIDFNLGQVTPRYDNWQCFWIQGLHVGVSVVF